jgi:hypothetical protein
MHGGTRYLVSAVVTGALAVSTACCPNERRWEDSESIDVGVSADLDAVGYVYYAPGYTSPGYLAVGSGGTVVAWNAETTAKAQTVPGEVDLHGVVSRLHSDSSEWWVIGDGGFAAVTNDQGGTWSTVDLATTADLHAIIEIGERVIVVGDDTVRVREPDGTWIEPPGSVEGWGQLRDIASFGGLWAVGLDGVIWTASDPSGEWVAEDSGTSADLFAAGLFSSERLLGAAGAGGTVVVRDADAPESEWRSLDSGIEVDIVDYEADFFLTAEGELLEAGYDHDAWGLEHVETFSGARAMFLEQEVVGIRLTVVGDAGSVSVKWTASCSFSKY